jgi:hypothetical protein
MSILNYPLQSVLRLWTRLFIGPTDKLWSNHRVSIGCHSGLVAALWGLMIAFAMGGEEGKYFGVQVVDAETGRGVPLVELETIEHSRFVTDNAGWIAIDESAWMGREVFFFVRSHGYAFPKDGFGFEGTALRVRAGDRVRLTIQRRNRAERVARLTGAGLLRDSRLLEGGDAVSSAPRADVVGCDSVLNAIYRDKLFWFWGDTSRPHHPLGGSFHMTGATMPLGSTPNSLGLDPMSSAEYFVDDRGAARAVAAMPGSGPTWLTGVTVVPNAQGHDEMVASYVKIRNGLESYRWGFLRWDDSVDSFREVRSMETRPTLFAEPQSHAFVHTHEGVSHVYFCNPTPFLRVAATAESYAQPDEYEGYTCLMDGTRFSQRRLDRDSDGVLQYRWRRNTPPLTQSEIAEGIRDGSLKQSDVCNRLRDQVSQRELHAHFGSVAWNAHRQSWIMIFTELGGESSMLGEVYLAESKALEGPWTTAIQVLTHDRYSFYNPKLHPYFDEQEGRIIHFEGTYTHTFSGNDSPTPRYDYNQVLYRLDLDSIDRSSSVP